MVKLADYCMKHEDQVEGIWTAVDADLLRNDAIEDTKTEFFKAPPKRVRDVDRHYMAEYLASLKC